MIHSDVNSDMDYYSFTNPEGMERWVGLVGWPITYPLPTKGSHAPLKAYLFPLSYSYRETTEIYDWSMSERIYVAL